MTNFELKSLESTTRVFIQFYNKSNRSVDIVWLDFTGQYVKYATIAFNQFVDINTFTTHPWICLDSETHDRMYINGQHIFYGVPNRRGRYRCIIQLPMYSLKTLTLLCVRNLLKNPEFIPVLELPTELKNDLQTMFAQQRAVPHYQ